MHSGMDNRKADGWRKRQNSSCRKRASLAHPERYCGFTLLEMIVVIAILMILLAIAVPRYNQHVIQAREAVLHSDVIELDKLIQQYTLDKRQAPQSLDDLKTAGYLSEIPKDPMTGQAEWETEQEDPTQAADPQQPGITKVHSRSTGTSTTGEAYSSW